MHKYSLVKKHKISFSHWHLRFWLMWGKLFKANTSLDMRLSTICLFYSTLVHRSRAPETPASTYDGKVWHCQKLPGFNNIELFDFKINYLLSNPNWDYSSWCVITYATYIRTHYFHWDFLSVSTKGSMFVLLIPKSILKRFMASYCTFILKNRRRF